MPSTAAITLLLAVTEVSCESLVSSSVREVTPAICSVRKLCTGSTERPMLACVSTRRSGEKRCVHSLFSRASEVPVRAVVTARSYGDGSAPTVWTSVESRSEW